MTTVVAQSTLKCEGVLTSPIALANVRYALVAFSACQHCSPLWQEQGPRQSKVLREISNDMWLVETMVIYDAREERINATER